MPRRRNRSKIKRNSRKSESADNTKTVSFEGIKYEFSAIPFGSMKVSECECDDHECTFELQKPPCKGCNMETVVYVFVDDYVTVKRPAAKAFE